MGFLGGFFNANPTCSCCCCRPQQHWCTTCSIRRTASARTRRMWLMCEQETCKKRWRSVNNEQTIGTIRRLASIGYLNAKIQTKNALRHLLTVLWIRRIRILWASRIASGSVSHKYGSGSFHHQAKIVRNTLISTVYDFFMTFYQCSGYVFGPSGSASGSVRQRYGHRSTTLPFKLYAKSEKNTNISVKLHSVLWTPPVAFHGEPVQEKDAANGAHDKKCRTTILLASHTLVSAAGARRRRRKKLLHVPGDKGTTAAFVGERPRRRDRRDGEIVRSPTGCWL